MSKRVPSRASSINAAVWLIGIGILWLTNMWWPGILILVGISMLVSVTTSRAAEPPPAVIKPEPVMKEELDEAIDEEKDAWEKDEEAETPAFMRSEPGKAAGSDTLPEKCPSCGGPVAENAHKVEWTGSDSAVCPFCDTPLPLSS